MEAQNGTGKAQIQGTVGLIHGLPKTGKTQSAASFPGPRAWLATEDGHRFLPEEDRETLRQLPPRGEEARYGWNIFLGDRGKSGKTLYEWLAEVKPKTIIIDTFGNLIDSLTQYVCHREKWETPAAGGKWVWDHLKKELRRGWRNFLDQTAPLGATRLLLCHTKLEEINMSRVQYHRLSPALGWPWDIISPDLDYIWHLGYDQVGFEGSEVSKQDLKHVTQRRCLWVSGHDGVMAGGRDPRVVRSYIGGIPRERQYDYIVEHLHKDEE